MQDVHIGYINPPICGMSAYLYRLSKLEKKAKYLEWKEIIGIIKFRIWLLKQLLDFRKKNFIVHYSNLREFLQIYLLSYVSVHEFSLVIHSISFKENYKKANALVKLLIRKALNKAKFIQVVNPEYKSFVNILGIRNKNIFVKNAFLPPPLEEESRIISTYNKETIKFLNTKNPIIIANGSGISLYKNVDNYGMDMCIELTYLLKQEFPNLGFIFALTVAKDNIENIEYFSKLKKRIDELHINNTFYFLTNQKEIWPIFKKADLMIRPTYNDGYGISIAEALYFGCPAIASDACKRPEGTIIFKNRDLNELYEKCVFVLKKRDCKNK